MSVSSAKNELFIAYSLEQINDCTSILFQRGSLKPHPQNMGIAIINTARIEQLDELLFNLKIMGIFSAFFALTFSTTRLPLLGQMAKQNEGAQFLLNQELLPENLRNYDQVG